MELNSFEVKMAHTRFPFGKQIKICIECSNETDKA